MITSDYGALGRAVYDNTLIKGQLDTLTQQASSGLVSDNFAGLGDAAQTVFDVSPQIAQLQAQSTAIDAVSGRLSVTQTVLTQINAIATSFNAQIASLNNVSPSQIDDVAAGARTALQQVAALLNTEDGGSYVFGGTDSATPPLINAAAITTSSFYTQIATAVAGLAANGAAATTAATLAVAQSNTAGTTPFANPAATAPTVALGQGAPVQTGLLAGQNTLALSTGSATTGSYTRDILRSLATLANLSSSQANDQGFTALVQDTQASLSGAIGAMGTEAGALGGIQSSLTATQTSDADTVTALKGQLSSVEDVNMAQTISDLSQVQTQLSASYKLISEISNLSLVQFL